ncbi:type VI secretion system protein TssA [Sphaerotilaceae bacterium SBD11-9]
MNLDALLTPISESNPCGEDLSFSSEFDAIAEMRRQDDPTLDQGEWVTTLKAADWASARSHCADLLAARSKDLRLAMWWAEAATLIDGYAGLQQGLTLCSRLCEQYWDGLYPEAEGGDMEQRVGNIGWFLGRVVSLATAAPVAKGRAGAFSLQQMQLARSAQATLERSPEKAAQQPADALTLDKFNRALRETPKDDLRHTMASLQASQEALAAWQGVIDARLGADGPSFVPAREALAAALHEMQRLAREVGALAAAPAHEAVAASVGSTDASTARPVGGPLRTREQALAQLREVAAFFRATEPHSPVAYLADKAVHWGDMPLHLWLRSVIKDGPALSHLEELLGLEPPREGSAG